MSFPRYPAYKDSGVEWLGQVPEHWEVRKLLNLARLESGHTPSRQHPEYWIEEDCVIPWFTLADVSFLRDDRNSDIETTSQKITGVGIENSAARLLPPDTVILSRTASVGFSGITTISLAVSQDFAAWICGPRLLPRFLLLCLRAMKPEFKRLMQGSTHQTIYMPDIEAFKVPLPPMEEQSKIVSMLAPQLAKIDALVAEQQRLMELLKEKRQAVISHAVTKGLNPDAPMKPSGIEWLGEVPEEWNVTPLGYLCHELSYGFTNPMPTTEDGPYMLTANDVDYGRVRFETARRTSRHAFLNELTPKSRPLKGDVLITKDGTLGRVALHDGQEACINQSVAYLRPKPELVRPEFMAACLLAGLYQARMIHDAGGTTIRHIYITRLAKMPIVHPSLSEQDSVLQFVAAETQSLDALTAEAQRAIDLLLERRSALISAAVTGQIDVRQAD